MSTPNAVRDGKYVTFSSSVLHGGLSARARARVRAGARISCTPHHHSLVKRSKPNLVYPNLPHTGKSAVVVVVVDRTVPTALLGPVVSRAHVEEIRSLGGEIVVVVRKAAPSDLITWSASFADVTQLADADGAMCAALGLPSAMDAPAFTAMKVYGPDASVQLSHQSAAAVLPSVDTVFSIVRAAAAARSSVPAPSVRKVWYAPNTFEAYGTEEIDAVTACLRDGWARARRDATRGDARRRRAPCVAACTWLSLLTTAK